MDTNKDIKYVKLYNVVETITREGVFSLLELPSGLAVGAVYFVILRNANPVVRFVVTAASANLARRLGDKVYGIIYNKLKNSK